MSRRTVYHWIETGHLDRELDAEPVRYGPRRRVPSKLDPYKAIIDERLSTYPKLSATWLWGVRESGYAGSYSQVKRYVRRVRPRAEPEPERRFETPPGRQGQVDFAEFVVPWGKRHALVVVLGYSRMLWLQYYERQTMETVVRGLEAAFAFFGGVPSELLFDQMRAVVVGDRRREGGRLLENREFLRFGAHWGFRIRACRAGRAQTKGKVERPVRARLWLDTVANVRVHGTLMERPVARFEDERRRLPAPGAALPLGGGRRGPAGGAELGRSFRSGGADRRSPLR